jgi:hypothetical protein
MPRIFSNPFNHYFYFLLKFHYLFLAEGDLAAFSHDHKTNHFKSGEPTASATATQVVSVGGFFFFSARH